MLPKEERDLIMIAGRYTYYKMKDLGVPLNIQSYKKYLDELQKDKRLKKRMGTTRYKKMKELNLKYDDFIQYEKEQKLKKYETKREKDKIRQRTVRYVERYCDLDMRCQICKTKESVQIHHPNYKDYLKVNLLCRKHHTDLHNFELIPPEIINLEEIAIITPPKKEKENYVNDNLENMKKDVMSGGATYRELSKKYNLESSTIKRYFLKENDYLELKIALEKNAKNKLIYKKGDNSSNPLLEIKIRNNLTTKQLSKITGIPVSTLRAIESGRTNYKNISYKTKRKLQVIQK